MFADGEPSDETLLAEKERFDEDYDKNMDGVLDSVEIRHWLVPDNQSVSDSIRDRRFFFFFFFSRKLYSGIYFDV